MLDERSTAPEIDRTGPRTAVLPIGSTEQHGPHLPVGTDSMIARAIAAQVADRIGALLLPVLPFSTCLEQRGSRGSVGVLSHTFRNFLADIAESLRSEGFQRLVLVVAHGGVFIAGPFTRETNAKDNGMSVIRIDLPSVYASSRVVSLLEGAGNLHACEIETSLMLHLDESLVRRDLIADHVPAAPREALNYVTFLDLCPHGVWGVPSLATKEKGERLFHGVVEASLAVLEDAEAALSCHGQRRIQGG